MKSTSRSILDAYNLPPWLCGRHLRVLVADQVVGLQERRAIDTELFRHSDAWLVGEKLDATRTNGPVKLAPGKPDNQVCNTSRGWRSLSSCC